MELYNKGHIKGDIDRAELISISFFILFYKPKFFMRRNYYD